jgi:hypothetical protein
MKSVDYKELYKKSIISFNNDIDSNYWINLIEDIHKNSYSFQEWKIRPHLTMQIPFMFDKRDSLSSIKLRSEFLKYALPAISTYIEINNLNNMFLIKNYIVVSKLEKNLSMPIHKDSFNVNSNHFLCTMYLNDNYTGGELKFVEHNITYKPKSGDIVFYRSQMFHEVLPSSDTRYSITVALTDSYDKKIISKI